MRHLLTRTVPHARRLVQQSSRSLSATNSLQGTLIMPERLQHIPDAEVCLRLPILKANSSEQDPGFFEMVEYFFHKACILSEDRLIEVDMKNVRATREEKANKAHGKNFEKINKS